MTSIDTSFRDPKSPISAYSPQLAAAPALNPALPAAPVTKRETVQENYAEYVTSALRNQLTTFEQSYLHLDLAGCQLGFRHFADIIQQVDEEYEQCRNQANDQLSDLQLKTISSMTQSRKLSQTIEEYLKAAASNLPIKAEIIVHQIMSSDFPEDEKPALMAELYQHPTLVILLKDYLSAARIADSHLFKYTQLQARVVDLADLRFTVRLMISQTYARLGQIDRASALKGEAAVLGGSLRTELTEQRMVANVEGIISRTDVVFHQRYIELLQFKDIFGHCDVPKRYKENRVLAAWVSNLRSRRKRGLLSQEKIDQLDNIGFCWTSTRTQWESRLADLANFIREHGHSFVPLFYARSPYLGTWVRNLRKECRRNAISADKIKQLQAIGFTFEVLDQRWSEKLEQLRQFKERTGHCRVPHYWSENPTLARWVNIQREKKKKNQLEPERLEQLEELGFDWEPPRGRPTKKA